MAKGVKTGGREAGTPNRRTVATRIQILGNADPISFLTSIMNGDMIKARPPGSEAAVDLIPTIDQRLSAARELARIGCPAAKDRPVPIALPPVKTADDVSAATEVVIAAMGAGEITPSEAGAIADVIETRRKAIELSELANRVAALEAGKGV